MTPFCPTFAAAGQTPPSVAERLAVVEARVSSMAVDIHKLASTINDHAISIKALADCCPTCSEEGEDEQTIGEVLQGHPCILIEDRKLRAYERCAAILADILDGGEIPEMHQAEAAVWLAELEASP